MGGTASKIKFPVSHPLHDAASKNDTERIKKLLSAVTNIEKSLKKEKKIDLSVTKFILNVARNEKGQTPLHGSVENNCFEATIMLIEEGCDVNAQDDRGDTVYHIAVRKEWHKIETHLMNLKGRFKDVQNKDGDTAFHLYVASRGEKRNVKLYIALMSTEIFNAEGYSPFHLAIKLGRWEMVKVLLEEQPHLAKQLSGNGEPPLWVALKHCQVKGHYSNISLSYLDMMQVLLNHGCDVNQKNTKIGAPTIWLAAYRQREEDVKATELLLGNPEFDKMTIESPSHDGTSPLLLAMIKGNEKLVDQLISVSANKNAWQILALKVKFALATKADFEKIKNNDIMLDATDNQGNTLLHLAVLSDSLEMVSGVVNAGCSMGSIKNVMDLAKERQCADILDCLTGIIGGAKIDNMKTITTFSIPIEFPKFSDAFEDLFDPLKRANQPSCKMEPNAKGQLIYEDIKKHIIPRVGIQWSEIEKVKGQGVSIFTPLSQIKRIQSCDDQNTDMVRDFLYILMHIETFLREEDELFRHLNVVLLPVGSTVEATKVFILNELDVMFFCTELHHFLLIEDEQSICLSEDKYNDLPTIIKDLFDLNTRKIKVENFYSLFMQAIKRASKDLVAKGKVPKNIKLFLDVIKCTDPDCKANAGKEWSQCHHKEPACVCYTAVGAGLNFVWKGNDENKNMVFTVDIVPNFYVDMNGHSNFNLRQKLIKHLMDKKPYGWIEFLKKYIRDDRIYLGQFDLEQKKNASVGIKMVNTRGDFFIRPGLNMHVQSMLEDEVIHETYCFLKMLKTITDSKVKSFDLKKAISEKFKESKREKPKTVIHFAKQILNSPDLKGKFDKLCQPLAEHYLHLDLEDFPATNCSKMAVHLVSKKASELLHQIMASNLREFQQPVSTVSKFVFNDLTDGENRANAHISFSAENENENDNKHLSVYYVSKKESDEPNQRNDLDEFRKLLHTAATSSEQHQQPAVQDMLVQGRSLLHFAAEILNVKIVRDLLVAGCDVNLQDLEGNTPLHCMLHKIIILMAYKHADKISSASGGLVMMIFKGGSFREVGVETKPFEMDNVEEDALVIVQSLLSCHQDDVKFELQNKDGCTVFHLLAMTDIGSLAEELLLLKATKEILDLKNNDGITAAMLACRDRHQHNEDTILNMLTTGINLHSSDNIGQTLLHYACQFCSPNLIDQLLICGAGVNVRNNEGSTPLMQACKNGNLDVVKLLLQNGADVNAMDNKGDTALTVAMDGDIALDFVIDKRYIEIIRHLVQSGANLFSGTPVLWALHKEHYDLAEIFIQRMADVNMPNSDVVLLYASQEGLVKFVRLLLEKGAAVDLADPEGVTPLYLASQNGHLELVKLLLDNGAAVNLADQKGVTPLYMASQNGHFEVIKLLLENGADVDLAKQEGVTPLCVASQNGHLELVKLLLESSAAVDLAIQRGITLLYMASQNGHLELVKLLLKNGASVDLTDQEGISPLLLASQNGHAGVVDLLLKNGAAVDLAKMDKGWTPLYMASQNDHLEVVQLLLANGADVDLATKDHLAMTPLHISSSQGKLEVVKLLLANGADINKTNKDNESPLAIAVKSEQADIVALLLEYNADTSIAAEGLKTPLYLACSEGLVDIVSLLINHGAAVDFADKNGITPLLMASMNDHSEMVDLLLKNGAAVDLATLDEKWTPLFIASMKGHLGVVELLLQHGAAVDLAIENDIATTPLLIACQNGHLEGVRLLLENGADINKTNKTNVSPLAVAVIQRETNIVALLLESNADTSIEVQEGQMTPLDLARALGHSDVIRMLLEHEYDKNVGGR